MNFKDYLEKEGTEPGLQEVLLTLAETIAQAGQLLRGEHGGYLGTENIHGEQQLQLDVATNTLFVKAFQNHPRVAALASEEMATELLGKLKQNGYAIAFDPLDGSSLVDANLAVGSIFGIYGARHKAEAKADGSDGKEGSHFVGRKGSEQAASLIVVYGPRLTFLVSVGKGVVQFLYDAKKGKSASGGEFILSKDEIKLEAALKMFAPGNLRACVSEKWYMRLLQDWVMRGYTLRYSGGMVPDVNQIFMKGGGVFTYPGYASKPEGKLRLLYECAPIAFLIEQAGGKAITPDGRRILEIPIEHLHQKTPIFLGSKKEVELVESYCAAGG